MTITVYYAVWGDPKLYGNGFLTNEVAVEVAVAEAEAEAVAVAEEV